MSRLIFFDTETTGNTEKLVVVSATNNQAVFQSTGSNRAQIIINNAAGRQQSALDFQNAGTDKWQLGNQNPTPGALGF